MPNTKSAERRMRNSVRKQVHNRSINTRLHTLEKRYLQLLGAGKKEDASKALVEVTSALDKAAKTGTVHKSRASRKKSRLTLQLNKLK
ncbi:MAG TPA: 30S ribosomal protein S20 [Verrucomicrobiae bacterium]|jgi:small subunit ribosomal protein S20|nr:30S ribosomal protein S20 [Verrucomicrobiae bacterium]